MDKLPLTSKDVLAEKISRIRDEFPEVFSEGKIDFDRLKMALGEFVDNGRERYGLSWAGKSEAIRNIQTPSVGTLLPVPEESVNFDTSENLIIEGDNLEVLKLLQKSYHGKIKMIYIDPPYNTGNEFIYPDNFREGLEDYLRYSGQVDGDGIKMSTNTETDGRFHSKWLNMMYPRLFLARNLLKEDGLIFVSIDDSEVKNLRAILDEIFGEENRIETIVWKKSYGGGAKEKYLVTVHEYILMYARNAEEIDPLWLSPNDEAEKRYYKFRDEYYESLGPYRLKPLEATKSMDKRENLMFPIQAPDGTQLFPRRQWWWAKERVMRALAEDKLSFTRNSEGGWTVSYKQYLRNETGEIRGSKAFSIFDGIYTQAGSSDMQSLFGEERPFQFPKPRDLILKLLDLCTSAGNGEIILDFFAGSGTTAHAVLDKNAQDSGNRKFILVQLPELTGNDVYPTIADITRDRVKRVIENLKRNDEMDSSISAHWGYRCFKLSSSNFELWESRFAEGDVLKLNEQLKLFVSHVRQGRNSLDVLYEVLLKSGLELTSDLSTHSLGTQTIFSVAGGLMMICLDELVQDETIVYIVKKTPRKFICLDAAFHGHDVLKTNLKLLMQSHDIEFQTV